MSHPEKNEVHCCACSRLITLAEGSKEGDQAVCPFCSTKMRLGLMTVFVAEALVEA
jgi:uncharacterized Zn-finger protein